jgi:hypothetical protein
MGFAVPPYFVQLVLRSFSEAGAKPYELKLSWASPKGSARVRSVVAFIAYLE